MESGVIAAVTIISVALIIIIFLLIFLFSGRCPPNLCKKSPPSEVGEYRKTDETIEKQPVAETLEATPAKKDDLHVENETTKEEDKTSDENKSVESSSSSSDEGVGDVEKLPSNDESSSSSSESDDEETPPQNASSNECSSSDPPNNTSTTDTTQTADVKDHALLSGENGTRSTPDVSIDDDGITLSLRLDNPAFEADMSSDSSSSSSEDEQQITVFRTFEEVSPEVTTANDDELMDETASSDSSEGSDKRDEVVAGIINVTSGEKLTISRAISKGLIPKKTGVLLLEAQAATGCVVNPKTGVKLTADEAVRQGIVDQQYKSILVTSEGAYYGYLDPRSNESVPLFEAIKRGIFPRAQGMRLLEAQVATGGIIDPWSGKSYPLSKAVNKGLIDIDTAKILTYPEDHAEFFDPNTKERFSYGHLLSKCIRDLNTGLKFLYLEEKPTITNPNYRHDLIAFRSAFKRTVTLRDLVKAGLVSQRTIDQYSSGNMTKTQLYEKVKPYLVGEAPIAGVYNRTNREVLTICQAVRKGLLRRGTALELLEAQAATGYVIDPKTGKQMSVNSAVSIGLVDGRLASSLRKAELAVLGYQSNERQNLSLFEAINRGLVIEIQGIRLLDAQIATGGIIDPIGGYRIPLSVAVKKGILNQELANKLANPTSDEKGYYDPNTDENVTYEELMRRTVIDKKRHVGMRLLPLTEKTPNVRVVSKAPTKARKKVPKNSNRSRVR